MNMSFHAFHLYESHHHTRDNDDTQDAKEKDALPSLSRAMGWIRSAWAK